MLNSTDPIIPLETRSPDVIVSTPFLGKATEFMLDCCAVNGLGLITGTNGSGKTITLQRLAARYEKRGLPGGAFYFCCRPSEGSTRAVKDLLAEMEIGGALVQQGAGTPLQLLFKVALREIQRRDIRLLLLDESNRCDSTAIEGVVALYDYMHEKGHPLTVILASAIKPTWMEELPSVKSRALSIINTGELDVATMTGVIREWADEFDGIADASEEGDKDAIRVLETIHKRVGKNLRRLNYFVRLYLRHYAGVEVTMDRVKSVFRKMTEECHAEPSVSE